LTPEQIESAVRSVATRGTLRADLNQIRNKLVHDNEVIKEVWVTRLLPDMLKVIIKEREPYTRALRGDNSVSCVDLEGVMFNCQPMYKPKTFLPLITGLVEGGGQGAEINRQRIAAYQKLLEEIDRPQEQLSSRIDKVVFDDVRGMTVILAESDVKVVLGKEDYRTRLNAALDVLDAVKRNDAEALNVLRISDAEKLLSGARISYLNATIPKRIIVGLDE
jgi:cell division septal protein FtsQ